MMFVTAERQAVCLILFSRAPRSRASAVRPTFHFQTKNYETCSIETVTEMCA